jgi:hypothetical protein
VGEKIGAALAHLACDYIGIADVFGCPAQLEGNERIETGAETGNEPPPLRLVNQRPGRRAAQAGDLFDIPKAEGGMAAFVEFYP